MDQPTDHNIGAQPLSPPATGAAPGPSAGAPWASADPGGPGPAPAAEVHDLWKQFGNTQALKGVSLRLAHGHCLGLVGRNGAGKSTVVSILSGLTGADRGTVSFEGRPAPSLSDPTAWHGRIATVYQHSMVVPWLTVAENVYLGRYPANRWGAIDWKAMWAGTRQVMSEWGLHVDERKTCAEISVEQRQVVEIARAVALGTRCLVLDEPTSALERSAVSRLFARVRALIEAGVAVLYISHHLEEVFEICDTVAVLRDGELVLSGPTSAVDEQALVAAMVGATSKVEHPELVGGQRGALDHGRPRLSVSHVRAEDPLGGILEDVSLEVAPGEVLGVTGLRGSGAATLGRVVAGAVAQSAGRVLVDGRALAPGRPDRALARGVGYVPEDRRAQGFVPQLGVVENTTMTIARRLSGRLGFSTGARRLAAASPLLASLQVVAAGPDQPVAELSGGNQQKVTVARAIIVAPGVLVAISPTRGVDVASKALLLGALAGYARASGAALLVATEELDDLVICHRALVMLRGQVFREFASPPFDRAELIAACEGIDMAGEGPAA
ncbi:MAG TPA: sugar ABC transporter ATP-binding protein [Acidimicrobiales bacterium]|nr:sugar ABC transporter ATP-binding protein [Acidimicrobiales bacterium]